MNVKAPIAIAGLAVAGGLMLTGCGALQSTGAQGGSVTPSKPAASNAQPSAGNNGGSNNGGGNNSGSGSNGNGGGSNGGSGNASGGNQCTAADVKGAIGPIVIGSTKDTSSNPASYPAVTYVDVTNTSNSTCTIDGFGGLEMYTGGDGSPAHINLTRINMQPAQKISLAPGEHAYKELQWSTTNNDNDNSDNVTVGLGYADVILPNDTQSFQAWPANHDKGLPNIVGKDVSGYPWDKNQPNLNALPH